MTIRNDVHKPSVIIPTDYAFVEFEYLGPDDIHVMLIRREFIRDHMKRTGGTYSTHAHGGNCHVCGAHCIYTALFHHIPSNTYIRTGLICSDKLDNLDTESFRKDVQKGLAAKAGVNKAQAVLELHELGPAWELWHDRPALVDDKYEERTIRSIVVNLIKYGNLSEKQVAFVRNLLKKIEDRPRIEAEKRMEYKAAAEVPVSDKRMHVAGEILTVRGEDTNFGYVTKILIKTDAGYKLWGTLPSAAYGAKRGDRIEFEARVERSEKDEKFGFFKRPTNSQLDPVEVDAMAMSA